MKPLIEEIEYKSKKEFDSLIVAIQLNIDSGNLVKYIDKTWRKERKDDWNGEYLSIPFKRMYIFNGSYSHSISGEPRFMGNWKLVRSEEQKGGKTIYLSTYQFRAQEPGIFSCLKYEIEYLSQEKTRIEFKWNDILNDGEEHSRLIKSSVEFGIISAFEDLNPDHGHYIIKLEKVRYHPIDSSFSLLSYTANRNLKRALFKEHLDNFPLIEKGNFIKKFKPNFTIIKYNNH